MTECPRCEAKWGGMNTAHCCACHLTFTGITAFDAHRKGGHCLSPKAAGLVKTGRDYPCYGFPTDDAGAWWKKEN